MSAGRNEPRSANGQRWWIEDLELAENNLSITRALAAEFLGREGRPTAVICHHDVLISGYRKRLNEPRMVAEDWYR
ncbi:hypothetical protein ACIBL3_44575 [Kribbella sp. NPDC050124]|uniref:hypothetical protein n=1 Tax=Kribbella sp. NPDC050124 TaxID=3364114 RepID=UPI0037A598B2